MENTKNNTVEMLFTYLFEILTNETFEQTKKRVHSGKNKFRIRNNMKNWMKETSKILDNTSIENQHSEYVKQIEYGIKNNLL